jgi:hypothetical protein
MLDARADIGDDFRKLRPAPLAAAVGEHPYRHHIFADAVNPAGQMIFGTEGGFQKTFDDLSIGKKLLFRSWRAAISWTSAEAGPAATTLTAMAAITAE